MPKVPAPMIRTVGSMDMSKWLSVRSVAAHAVFGGWRMLPKKRTSHLGMAFVAGLVERAARQRARRGAAVRGVAVAALHAAHVQRILRDRDFGEVRAEVIGEREEGVGLCLQAAAEQNGAVLSTERGDALLDLRTEVPHKTLDGPCCGIAQGANCAAFDLFAVWWSEGGYSMKICIVTYVSSRSMSISR